MMNSSPSAERSPAARSENIASITGLNVRFPTPDNGKLAALRDLSLTVRRGESLGIVGESGSGKSMLGMAMLGLIPHPGQVSGSILIDGTEVVGANAADVHRLRGSTIGLVLQDPTASLNPLRTIRSQLAEALRLVGVRGDEAEERMREGLLDVGLDPKSVLRRRPFELSGGMNQRIAIAMALLQRPQLLIADEPTTALDVVVQLEVLDLLRTLQKSRDMALVMISHDLAVVDQLADRVVVMYGGRLVENGSAPEIVRQPAHPYTRALLESMPSREVDQKELRSIPGQFRQIYEDYAGCPFADRCDLVRDECRTAFPARTVVSESHDVWCWAAADLEGASR